MNHEQIIDDVMQCLKIGEYKGDMEAMRVLIKQIYQLGRIDGNLEGIRNALVFKGDSHD